MSGHRRAAVALHGLAEADRVLILDELPAQDQQVLRDYINELDELGFDTATAVDLPAQPAPAVAANEAPADALQAASPDAVHAALAGEPASLVAQLLSIEAWRWRGAYLALQTSARSELLHAAAPAGALAPARAAFLRGALAERLQRMDIPAATAAPAQARPVWWRFVRLPWTR
ncbi:hypothetical protein E7V67_022470 [[Empedobacter] haloabium]|uniref:Uncharacterized protein n=1 Tax=[Empedobacter] haloabium TaxID=592317 RepID=A0ABZ1UI76_9BURK